MNNDLVLGKGEVHFNLFEPGTKSGQGERYLGNTPGFTLTAKEDSVERKSVLNGIRHLTDIYTVERGYVTTVICDQISSENMALWLGSTSAKNNIAATGGGSPISETITVVQGLGYQLGTDLHPLGQRNLINIVFKVAGSPITQSGNVVVDPVAGRFSVVDGAPNIPSDTSLTIEYKTTGYARSSVKAPRELKGSIRYIADNVYGKNTDYFFPYVSLQADGAFDLKTMDWQQMRFNMSVMKLFGKELFYAGSFA